MTTKRKQILQAIAKAVIPTFDDLLISTKLQRKNLHDNLKSAMQPGQLLERIRDDVTGLPAYKLTPKGRAWLENDQSSSVKPKPGVGQNPGSIASDLSSVAGGMERADLLAENNAAKAPPKPDRMPVEVSADEIKDAQRNADLEVRLDSAGRSIVEFCEWMAKKAKVRCPLNLHECKAVITDAMQANDIVPEFEAMALAQAKTIKALRAEVDASHERIANLESNAELLLQTKADPPRYIVAENYVIAKSESESNDYAVKIAKEIEIDTPVVVFAAHKARELRINWRDA